MKAKSVDDEIEKALEGADELKAADQLAELKKKMGLGGDSSAANNES